ncbi:uncharacterized protein LOC109718867 isoform X1 [Ananas comosus]|uniref:Uncharacterized protein LOC109718867 isoform X1 n=1 Tax=Ananas comosus TaxID=4615 RepID=A0A6P5G6N7_ANACO|nr:uncharacterized protein LOC109718867 isoform X1 [Ananas comosus]
MEEHSAAARRRLAHIFEHVAGAHVLSPHTPNLFPVSCSSTLNTIPRRSDNTLFFARQGSTSQANYMQQSTKQNFELGVSCSRTGVSCRQLPEGRMSSRPAQMTSRLCNSGVETLNDATPQFARQGKIEKLQQASVSTGATFSSEDCCDWSPRMDVAETGANYVVTVELPGVRISDILVEVDEQNLTVTGERSIQQQTAQIYPENCRPKYHQKQILQGPYRVVWALPNDANKDNVTAKFV